MTTKKKNLTPPAAADTPDFVLKLETERKAFEAVKPDLLGLAEHDVKRRSVSMRGLRDGCLELAEQLSVPEVAARMAGLTPAYIPAGAVAELVRFGHAAGHIDRRLRDAIALGATSSVSQAELEEAESLRETMQAIVLHNCKSRPAALAKLSLVGESGSGPLDLAEDLDRLAELYTENLDLVSQDGVNFKATQAKRALELYTAIKAALDAGSSLVAEWQGLAHRCYTQARPRFDLLLEGARFALIGRPEREALRSLGSYRKPPTKSAPKDGTGSKAGAKKGAPGPEGAASETGTKAGTDPKAGPETGPPKETTPTPGPAPASPSAAEARGAGPAAPDADAEPAPPAAVGDA
jgi:hypothetical protein